MTVPAAQGSDSEALRILRAARARIEKGWTQGSDARDAQGRHRDPHHPEAICWCLTGAYYAEPDSAARDQARRYVQSAVPNGERTGLTTWNDRPERTKAEVLAVLDRAIALAEGNAPLAAPSAIPSPAPPETP